MKTRIGRILVGAALPALALGAYAALAQSQSKITASAMQKKAAALVTLPPGLEQRLKSAGLDAGDPQLSTKLKGRHDAFRRLAKNAGGTVTAQPMSAKRTVHPPAAAPTPGLTLQRTVTPSGPPSLEILQASASPWEVSGRLKVRSPKTLAPSDVKYQLSGPCGLNGGGTLWKEDGAWVCCFYDEQGSEFMNLSSGYHGGDVWKLGGTGRTVTLTFSSPGLPSATKTFENVVGSYQQVKVTLVVDSAPPFLGSNQAGIQASNANFGGSGARSNDGAPWVATNGQDTLGLGIFLGKGYSVTDTKIVSAHSKLDAPGSTAAENAYRYAKIKTKPDAGRLQTVVDWMYGPGESLSYTIEWTLTGPMGQRPLTTMPLSGDCDS
jgi:hypothetical protein